MILRTIHCCSRSCCLLFVISQLALSQDEILNYKRINVNIGDTEWVIKSADGTSCIVEVESSSILFDKNNKLVQNDFQPVLRIKRGLLLLEYPIHTYERKEDELVPTISIRRKKDEIILLCKRHDNSIFEITLKDDDFKRLEDALLNAERVSKNMNVIHKQVVSNFKHAVSK